MRSEEPNRRMWVKSEPNHPSDDVGLAYPMNTPYPSLFHNQIDDADVIYRGIRDNSDSAPTKALLEQMWAEFEPYADTNFRTEFAKPENFESRLWEMYLGYTLLLKGKQLERTQGKGPDFHVASRLGAPIWIEATTPSAGEGHDAVPKWHDGPLPTGFTDAIILRLRNAIESKHKKLLDYLNSGTVGPNDPFVIAINGHRLLSGWKGLEPNPPRIVRAVLPLGDSYITYSREKKAATGGGHKHRPEILKLSGNSVSTTIFQDPAYRDISAILYCDLDVCSLLVNESDIGLDYVMVHNPLTGNPVAHRWLPCGREFWVDGSQLFEENYMQRKCPRGDF